MKQINILIDSSKIIFYHIFPLILNRKNLFAKGYKINFYRKLNNKLLDSDILILLSKPIIALLNEKEIIFQNNGPSLRFLQNTKPRVDRLIWMDTSDSTSVTHFEVLPYVDLYLKKQLFRDKSNYQTTFYGGRIFTDFYHKQFGINDSKLFAQYFSLPPNQYSKVDLSWNIGLGNMFNAFDNNLQRIIQRRFFNIIKPDYNIKVVVPNLKKEIDVLLKTSTNLSRETVAFHRKELVNRLKVIVKSKNLQSVIQGKRLPDKEFKRVMMQTKIFPSPFGWGEIGVRDYEAFIYGGVLLKPTMKHMITWPNVFIENETYIPIEWDYNNLEEKIQILIEDSQFRVKIARQGQKKYLDSISEKGMSTFCDWFINQIEK